MVKSRRHRSRKRSRKRRGGLDAPTKSAQQEFQECMAAKKGLMNCMKALKEAEKDARKTSYAAFKAQAAKKAIKAVAPAVQKAEATVDAGLKTIEQRKAALAKAGLTKQGGRKRRRKSRKLKKRRKSRKTKRRRKNKSKRRRKSLKSKRRKRRKSRKSRSRRRRR